MPDTSGADKTWLATIIALGKDLVALLRDGALFLLAVLLIAFPTQFNTILVNAGFEEGRIVGFSSTVFYYAPSSQRTAKEVAALMKSLTGKDFGVQRGAGLGVVPSRRETTLYIHYVRN